MSFAFALALASPAARAADAGDIVVVSVRGDVQFTANGAARALKAGDVLVPPATVRTGVDGAVELAQGATTVSVGPETLLEFPALERRGAPIDRVIQPRGNAFYDVGKRNGRKLRVEAPYLVGVVKGTQFNVAAHEEATTISLYEGSLEVRAADDSDVVDLEAGEIASRKRDGKAITVLKMKGDKPAPPSRPHSNNGAGGNEGGTRLPVDAHGDRPDSGGNARVIDVVGDAPRLELPLSVEVDGVRGGELAPVVDVSVPTLDPAAVDAGVELSAGAVVGGALDVDTIAAVDLSPANASAAIDLDTRVDAGNVSVDVGASVAVDFSPAGMSAGVDLGAGADVGGIAADVGAGAAVDLSTGGASAAVDLGAGVEAGPVTADVGAGAAVDLSTDGASAAVDLGAGVDAGPVTADVGAGAAVDVGRSVDVAADVTVDTGVVAADTTVAVDTGAGNVDVGLGVAGVDVGIGLNLGLEPATDSGGTDSPATPEPILDIDVDVGGLLNGLLRRPRR